MVNGENDLLRLIPLLPLMGAVFHGVMIGIVRRAAPPAFSAAVSCGVVILSFIVSCAVFGDLLGLPEGSRVLVDDVYTWIGVGIGSTALSAELAFRLDPLSAVMILIVTGVGSPKNKLHYAKQFFGKDEN